MNERQYQAQLIGKIKDLLPGSYVTKNDPGMVQGVPDILILHRDKWAMLEIKASPDAPEQPNQAHYVNVFNEMSFASFINPDNEEAVLNALQHSFGLVGESRIPQSE